MYETGAGGSAPKHVQQFLEENHLRWDSLGEFLALSVSIEDVATKSNNTQAKALAECLTVAISKFLREDKSPSRKVGELDNRGSHFYLAMYWAEALSQQDGDLALKEEFLSAHTQMKEKENQILNELNSAQGQPMDINGYYRPDAKKVEQAMRPSASFNTLIESLSLN